MPTAIHIDGFIPQPEAAVYTLNGPDLESTNEHGNHDAVVIVRSGFSRASSDFTYVFPAHSVTAIELQQMAGD
jgi:alpha-L-arabinofuranosidase